MKNYIFGSIVVILALGAYAGIIEGAFDHYSTCAPTSIASYVPTRWAFCELFRNREYGQRKD